MRKSNKFIVIAAAVLLLSGCSKSQTEPKQSVDRDALPVETVSASYSIDVYDPNEVIIEAHYVFVGRVEEEVGVEYLAWPVSGNEADAEDFAKDPYTNYNVTVLENIKGNLQTDTVIPIQKFGGITKDSSSIVSYSDDYLPKPGDICLFVAFVQSNGTILSEGGYASQLLENGSAKTYSADGESEAGYQENTLYQDYITAAQSLTEEERNEVHSEEYDAGSQ